jgi:AmmeMemoRadiSam system protein A
MSRGSLSTEDRHALLALARAAITRAIDPSAPAPAAPRSPALLAPGAAFVTLRLDRSLRGCIGTQRADRPLGETVREMAVAAATQDPRFPTLTPAELAATGIEISVLSPAEPIAGPDDVVLGQHGVTVDHHGRRGLFLPQVPLEAGWDAPRLLAEVCRKAGLPSTAWREPGARLARFTTESFAEREA